MKTIILKYSYQNNKIAIDASLLKYWNKIQKWISNYDNFKEVMNANDLQLSCDLKKNLWILLISKLQVLIW